MADQRYYVVRVNEDDLDVYAAQTRQAALDKALPGPNDKVEVFEVDAEDAAEARLKVAAHGM